MFQLKVLIINKSKKDTRHSPPQRLSNSTGQNHVKRKQRSLCHKMCGSRLKSRGSWLWSQVLDKMGPYALWGRNVFYGNRNLNWNRQKALWGMNVALVMAVKYFWLWLLVMALLSFGRGALIHSTFGRGALIIRTFGRCRLIGCGDSRLVVAG